VSTNNTSGQTVFKFFKRSDLLEDCETLAGLILQKYPDLAGVIALPRSGFYPATTIATAAGLPLYYLRDNRVYQVGHGLRLLDRKHFNGPLVLVDDSANTGRAMSVAKAMVPNTIGAVVYGTERSRSVVEVIARPLELPHYFSWHMFGSELVKLLDFGFDMDGVLCRDPLPHQWIEPSDGYDNFLETAEPLYVARPHTIPAIVTARLERHREATRQWLRKHRITYKKLVMGPWSTPAERTADDIGKWKAEQVQKLGLKGFIESNHLQSQTIAQTTGLTVVCTDAGVVYSSGS
jgi:hypothetical protein